MSDHSEPADDVVDAKLDLLGERASAHGSADGVSPPFTAFSFVGRRLRALNVGRWRGTIITSNTIFSDGHRRP